MTDRAQFLKAFAGLFVVAAVPLPALAKSVVPAAPLTLEGEFYAALGPIKNVAYVGRPGLDRLFTVSQAFHFRFNGHVYENSVDWSELTHSGARDVQTIERILRTQARALGAHAKNILKTMEVDEPDDISDVFGALDKAWWRKDPTLWPMYFQEITR